MAQCITVTRRVVNMVFAELIEQLRALPQDKQAEVFDFVEFLSQRGQRVAGAANTGTEWVDAEFSSLAMAQALRDEEDDPVVYTRADLRERWQ